MDPFTLLKNDHEMVKTMMSALESTTEQAEKKRTEIFDSLRRSLSAHEAAEEEFLYPAVREKAKARSDEKDVVLEAYMEHHVADLLVAELAEMPVTDEMWGAKAKVLQENLEHHIEEEEGPLFEAAKSLLDADELDQIGDLMDARMRELMDQATPAPPVMMPDEPVAAE